MTQKLPNFEDIPVIALGRTDSTNAEGHRRAEAGAAHGTLLWATEQTAGRGRRGREWISKPGNLYASLVLRPDCEAKRATQIAFVAALAVSGFLGDYFSEAKRLQHKWPNDVLVDGRKLAGILAESRMGKGAALEWLVLGVGVNVDSYPEDVEWPAISLREIGGKPAEIAELVEAFGRAFTFWYNTWQKNGFESIREAWLDRAVGLGEPIRVRLQQETIEGLFTGLDEDGTLLVLKAGETVPFRVTAGDVFPTAVLRNH